MQYIFCLEIPKNGLKYFICMSSYNKILVDLLGRSDLPEPTCHDRKYNYKSEYQNMEHNYNLQYPFFEGKENSYGTS